MNAAANTGNTKIRQPGINRYQIIMRNQDDEANQESMKATIIVAVGTISRGKYTLLIRPVFADQAVGGVDRAVEKNSRATSQQRPSAHTGAEPLGSLASVPKMIGENQPSSSTGRITAQATPITVCL